jgi:hypothetical protein
VKALTSNIIPFPASPARNVILFPVMTLAQGLMRKTSRQQETPKMKPTPKV